MRILAGEHENLLLRNARKQPEAVLKQASAPLLERLLRKSCEMVLLYYYDQRGSDCLQMLQHEQFPTKVLLHPFEGWACPSLSVTWLLTPLRFSKHKLLVTELYGGARTWSTVAALRRVDGDPATLHVVGSRRLANPTPPITECPAPRGVAARLEALARRVLPARRWRRYAQLRPSSEEADCARRHVTHSSCQKCRFRLTLSTRVTDSDFQLGYCLAGTVEYGCHHADEWSLAYYSLVRRRDADPDHQSASSASASWSL